MAHISRWHWANAKNQSSLRCLVKEISNSRTASRTVEQSALLSYLFETSFKNALKSGTVPPKSAQMDSLFMIDLFNTQYFANQILIANTKMRWSPSIYNTRTFFKFFSGSLQEQDLKFIYHWKVDWISYNFVI